MKLLFILIFQILLFGDLNISKNSNHTNSLISSTSPYLLSHAHNPVNWYAWNTKSLQKAKDEKKLIFLSIGYSSCHWCHIMEQESFENLAIAKELNTNYISIKVDKEQMPQIDAKYQMIHSYLNHRRNGWPLHIIMTPNLEIMYSTTYIPPRKNYGVEGMNDLIPRMNYIYHHNNELHKLITLNQKIISQKEKNQNQNTHIRNIKKEFVKAMSKRYDKIYKGFDKAPKFPLASHINLLLNIYELDGDQLALDMAISSLKAMANGGIYDQIEGGFFRYSTLSDWIIPHFEKMLYTNAELSQVYLKAYKITHNQFYKDIAFQTIDFVIDKFEDDNKTLFLSASDADSLTDNIQTKKEGYYYTYTYNEANQSLRQSNISNSEQILQYLGFEVYGNFENRLNNPYISNSDEPKPDNLNLAIEVLRLQRADKPYPYIDTKILSSWNAMMIKSLFIASKYDDKYKSKANKSLDSLISNFIKDDNIIHQLDGNSSILLLEDYSFFIDTLIQAHQTTLEKKYINLAQRLYQKAKKEFFEKDIWYLDNTHFAKAGFQDRYYTAPLSRMFHNMLQLSALSDDYDLLYFLKNQLKYYKNNIFYRFDNYPEAINAILRTKYEDIIIKSSYKNLKSKLNQISRLSYPYILVNPKTHINYQVCSYTVCFKEDNSYIFLEDFINKSLLKD